MISRVKKLRMALSKHCLQSLVQNCCQNVQNEMLRCDMKRAQYADI